MRGIASGGSTQKVGLQDGERMKEEKKKEEQRGSPWQEGVYQQRLPKSYTPQCQACSNTFTCINILIYTITPHEVGIIVTSLPYEETKHRQVKQLDQGHTARGCLSPQTVLLISRKKFVAVDNVNFDIYKGETFSLVGESGSGKTTIGRAITRINPVSKGEILFKGQKISGKISKKLDLEVIKKCQMIFQQH